MPALAHLGSLMHSQAVRREVFEESRVLVADVAVVGSQPWPVGRYGGCELMLGCLGKARNYEVLVNTDEVRAPCS